MPKPTGSSIRRVAKVTSYPRSRNWNMLKLILSLCLSAAALFASEPVKIVLVAGNQSHGPGDHEYKAGCILLAKFLKQNGVADPVVVTGGWPEKESVFDGAS